MTLLYNNGDGHVYRETIKWIDEYKDAHQKDMLCTAVLALGNFARNDNHCIHMVQTGLSVKLIG